MGRFGRLALGALLACSLVPMPAGMAVADEVAGSSGDGTGIALAPGTYVEHEAIAYVVDGGVQAFSLGDDVLAGAKSLMDIDADTAAEALGDETAVAGAPAARSRSASDSVEAAGRLVLVRDEGKSTEELIAELEADPRVAFAEPNAIVKFGERDDAAPDPDVAAEAAPEALADEDEARRDGEADVEGSAPGEPSAPVAFGQDEDEPAADLNGFVWGFDNDGRLAGTTGSDAADMGYANWNNQSAASQLEEVVVAVIDTGVDASNPDLAPVMWDKGLTSGIEGLTGKEDENGFAVIADAEAGVSSTTGLAIYHGTHVAGTIGAAWDGRGVSGLAGNARIMSVRVDDTLSGTLEGFDYVSRARDAGVDVRVTNNSWGFGQAQGRSVDLAVTKIGRQGVVSVFASGNSTYDNDAAGSTAGTLADNPYAVVVDSIDPTGDLSVFTQFGETTTDVMAPGSTILSTYATGEANAEGCAEGPRYLGEEDAGAVLYESFDGESHAADGVDLSDFARFADPYADETCEVVEGGRRFDGDAALELSYSLKAAEGGTVACVESGEVDLSGQVAKPTHLSIRYTAIAEDGLSSVLPRFGLAVRTRAGGWAEVATKEDSFGYGGDSWAGLSGKLPDDVDWAHFQVRLRYRVNSFSLIGGANKVGPCVPGTLVVDSIGLGSDLVPYLYQQGTSMACPAVAGTAAVITGQGLDRVSSNDPAKKAEKLTALVKGAAVPDARYEGLCSTAGRATVDGAANPGPAITGVVDDGSAMTVCGYFMPEGTVVLVDGAPAAVSARADLGDGRAELTVQKPEGFMGGQVVVRAEAGGKRASHRADLGKRSDTTYYDQTNLPIPDELDEWESWQLVGFGGDVYCLPRASVVAGEESYNHMLRYHSDKEAWDEVPLPTGIIDGVDLSGGAADVTGATLDGALVLQLLGKKNGTGAPCFVRYAADGTWEGLDLKLPDQNDTPSFSTLASDGACLYLFGGFDKNGDSAAVYRADLETRVFEKAGKLSTGRIRPHVAYGNGSFAVSGGISWKLQGGGVPGAELLKPREGILDVAVGEQTSEEWLESTPVDLSALVTETGQLTYAPGAVADGFALVGPTSDDGATDTYLLSAGEEPQATAYGKKASQQALLAPAATAYRGRLYVLAASQNEPYRVFSATAMDTHAQPGDAEIVPEPEPEPLPEPAPEKPASMPTSDALGATPKALASTGDPLAAAPLLLAAIVAAACLTAAASGRALSRTRPMSTRAGRRRDRS